MSTVTLSAMDNNNSKQCILCGRCLEVCPLFRVTGREELSPRGKGFLLEKFRELDLRVKSVVELARLCAGCRRCVQTCPQKLDLPLEIARLKSHHPDWKAWIWSRLIKSGHGFIPLIKGAAAIIPETAPVLKHASRSKASVSPLLKIKPEKFNAAGRAVVFPGCAGMHFHPELEKKAARVLQIMGYEVLETPKWQCCGYPLGSAGLFEQEQRELKKNLETWQATGRPQVFVFCATCLDGLKNSFSLLDGHPHLDSFRQSVRHLLTDTARLEFEAGRVDGQKTLLWHEPCHGTGSSGAVIKEIFKASGLEIVLSDKKCCGMGGSFAVQNPDLSRMIADDFWQSIPGSGKILVLTDCSGCVLQLEATRPDHAQVAHWLEIIGLPV